MPTKKLQNGNGKIPNYKDFPPPKRLTADQKELLEATREVVKMMDENEKKYGKPPDFRH